MDKVVGVGLGKMCLPDTVGIGTTEHHMPFSRSATTILDRMTKFMELLKCREFVNQKPCTLSPGLTKLAKIQKDLLGLGETDQV